MEAVTGTHRPHPQLTIAPPEGGFRSILFGPGPSSVPAGEEPPFFADLNLDQVVEAIVAGRDEYDLVPFFHQPLRDERAVAYRHEVFRDLERDGVRDAVRSFAHELRRMRRRLGLAEKQHYRYERERWFLDAVASYCDAVTGLAGALAELELASRGLRALRDTLADYARSEQFTATVAELRSVQAGLDGVRYTLRIKGPRVTVSAYRDENDYSVEVADTFARFRERTAESHLAELSDPGAMDHVEARISELVARLHPDEFHALDAFYARHADFVEPLIATFDREVQFYLAYLEHVDSLAGAELAFCYPTVSTRSRDVAAEDAFDLALAAKLGPERVPVVPNDLFLADPERIIVVTGPNQGGKTTFARTFGQLHYLAGLGVPVPGRSARLFLPDRLFTHFEREESIATLRGKLEEELVRVRAILEQATPDSIVILNEVFASTMLDDAIYLGTEVLGRIAELGCLGICVTFVDELASLGESTVSMVATVEPDDPARRTFRIVRRPADGRAYAWAIADKYGLSTERLAARIGR